MGEFNHWNLDLDSIFVVQPESIFVKTIKQALQNMKTFTVLPLFTSFFAEISELDINDDVARELEFNMIGCYGESGLELFLTKEYSEELNDSVAKLFSQSMSYNSANAQGKCAINKIFLEALRLCPSEPKEVHVLEEAAFFKPNHQGKDDEEAFKYVVGFVFRSLWDLHGHDKKFCRLFRNSILVEKSEIAKKREHDRWSKKIDRDGLTYASDEGYYFCLFLRELISEKNDQLHHNTDVLKQWEGLLGTDQMDEKEISVLSQLISKLKNTLATGQARYLKEKILRSDHKIANSKKRLRKKLKESANK